MKVTIIPDDKAVGKDGLFYLDLNFDAANVPADVHALQWNDNAGWIEYRTTIPNEPITELPDWALACVQLWDDADYITHNPPAPTPDQIKADVKSNAERLLQESDWTMLPDVNLANKTEWAQYRSALRAIVFDPQVDSVFPDKPQEVWA